MFTQTSWDSEGYAVRDPDSTTYIGAIETAEEFGKRIYLEAWNRGWPRAETKVFMGDGSEWIWHIAEQHFPGAIPIVDLFHTRQHLWDLARKLYPNQEAEQRRWMMVHQDLLDEGKIEEFVAALRAIDSSNLELATRSVSKPDISKTTRGACATPSSTASTYSSAPASSKPDARA